MNFLDCPCYLLLGRTNWASFLGRCHDPVSFRRAYLFLELVEWAFTLIFKPYQLPKLVRHLPLKLLPYWPRTTLNTHSLLTCSALDADHGGRGKRVYGLAPISKYFVPDQGGISLSPFFTLIQDKVFMDSWSVCSIFLLCIGVSLVHILENRMLENNLLKH